MEQAVQPRRKCEIIALADKHAEQINHSLLGFPLRNGERVYWIYYYTCKFCEDYMIESKRCHNCEKIQGE